MLKKIFDKFSHWMKIDSVEQFKIQSYTVYYLDDCGAGYMGYYDGPFEAASLQDAIKNYESYDIEKVYCDGELVYKASWSDDNGIVVNKVGIY